MEPAFLDIDDARLRAAATWEEIDNDDQVLLWRALQETPGARRHTRLDTPADWLINYASGRFIRQVTRASSDPGERLCRIKAEVDRVLGADPHG